jgi:hypothetical protein
MTIGDFLPETEKRSRRQPNRAKVEPDNPSYAISLVQYQYLTRHPEAARKTLEPLLRANADERFRSDAEKFLLEINQGHPLRH